MRKKTSNLQQSESGEKKKHISKSDSPHLNCFLNFRMGRFLRFQKNGPWLSIKLACERAVEDRYLEFWNGRAQTALNGACLHVLLLLAETTWRYCGRRGDWDATTCTNAARTGLLCIEMGARTWLPMGRQCFFWSSEQWPTGTMDVRYSFMQHRTRPCSCVLPRTWG